MIQVVSVGVINALPPLWPAAASIIIVLTYHVLEAAQHCSSDDAQEEGDDVENGGRPQQMVEVHHVLATPHLRVFMVATHHFHPAGPVGLEATGKTGSKTGWSHYCSGQYDIN